MDLGRKRRLLKIMDPHKPAVIVPIDHGFSSGPIIGLESVQKIASWVNSPHISAILAHRGILERLIQAGHLGSNKAAILHLNGSPLLNDEPHFKRIVCEVSYAHHMACEAVSIDLNFKPALVGLNFELLGSVIDKAHAVALPVLVMLSDRNKDITDEVFIHNMRSYIRSAYELGVDIIKISVPVGKPAVFYKNLLGHLSEDVPIVVAGGEKTAEESLFTHLLNLRRMGARGVCVGRNVFQSPDPLGFLGKLSVLIHEEMKEAENVVEF